MSADPQTVLYASIAVFVTWYLIKWRTDPVRLYPLCKSIRTCLNNMSNRDCDYSSGIYPPWAVHLLQFCHI